MTTTRAADPVSYTNRKGQVYSLHAGHTKTGKRRYFVAKTVGAGALAELPAGFEIVESINAVVSVRRIDPSARKIPEADLARVRAELARHPRLLGVARTLSKARSSSSSRSADCPTSSPAT